MNPLSTKPTYLNYRGGVNGRSDSSNSSVASFPTTTSRHPIPNAAPQSQLRPSTSTPNTASSVLIYVPGLASPGLPQHLAALFSQHRIHECVLLGPREDVLKALRTDVYTVAGRLRQDVAVTMRLLHPDKVDEGVKGVVKRGLVGVVVVVACEERDGEGDAAAQEDVLELGGAELEAAWRTSVLPLHALLRHALPLLASSGHANPFFYLDPPAAAAATGFATASARALLAAVVESSPHAANVTIGAAADHLPAISESQSMRSFRVDTAADGGANWDSHSSVYSGDDSPVQVESPTKLWASWAAQNDYF